MSGVKLNSERREAPQAEALLRDALAAGGVGTWAWDLTADAFSLDAVARRLWGIAEPGPISAVEVLAAVHPEDVAALRTAALAARAAGECQATFRLAAAGGETRLRIGGRLDRGAGLNRIVGIVVDVTGRKPPEAEAGAPEARLRRAQAAGGALPFEWDACRDHLVAAPAFNELYGLGPDDTLNLAAFLARLHPDDRDRVEAAYRRLLAEPGPFEAEFRIVAPDGSLRHLLSRGETVRDAGGAGIGITGVNLDITGLKETEQDLRRMRREARMRFRELRALYQNAPVGLALIDRNLRFVRVNEALARMNGLPVAAHAGRYVFDVVPALQEAAEPLLRRVLETGQPISDIEFTGDTPQAPGVQRSWVEQFYPVKNQGERVIGVGVVAQEVTEQRQVERARDLLGRELSHRIKNLFAVIASIVRLSARGNEAVQPFAETVRGRIDALGRAHDYVRPLETDHDAAVRSGRTLHNLLGAILAPYQGAHGERVRIIGCDTTVGAAAATAFALTIHEFATNAVKYGALSTAEGAVEITCRAGDDTFELVWSERGGPPVEGPPVKEGFGTLLARRNVTAELGGDLVAEWTREGLTIRLTAPVERLAR